MRKKIFKKDSRSGAAILLTVLLIGGIVIEIGLANLISLFYLNQNVFAVRLGAEALAAAKSGLEDAKVKVMRNKDFNTSGLTYTLNIGSQKAVVTVCKDILTPCGDDNVTGKTEVVSVGTSGTRSRKLKAKINVDSITGEIRLEAVEELSL